MSTDIKQNVDTDSTEFTEGVEARLNSAEDTKNWKAGNELGQALKEDGEPQERVYVHLNSETPTPLFIKKSSDGQKGNFQDEKDGTVE